MREPKPEWSTLPHGLRRRIESRLGSEVSAGAIAWGGYTPSATFRLALADGREVFCKAVSGAHAPRLRASFVAERGYFRTVSALSAFAPPFLGHVEAEAWCAMLFTYIDDAQPIPPWDASIISAVLARLGELHRVTPAADLGVPPFEARHLWRDRLSNPLHIAGFASLFADPPIAAQWLLRHRDTIVAIETAAAKRRWQQGLMHLDLRSDNVLCSRSRGVLFVDWPYLSIGPRMVDLGFLLPSLFAEGGPTPAYGIELYEQAAGVKFSRSEIAAAAVLVAGFFAAHAHLADAPEMPRLRLLQRAQLYPALQWMCAMLNIEPPLAGVASGHLA